MKATGHVGLDEPFAGLFTQGMVVHETYRSKSGEWVAPAEVKIEGDGDAPPGDLLTSGEDSRDRRHRENVEVEAQHGRSRRDHRQLRRRCGALVHVVGLAARPRRRMDRARRAGRLAVFAAAMAAGRRSRRNRPSGAGRTPGAVRRQRALALRKSAHRALAGVTADIEKLHFNVCVAQIYEFANMLNEFIGDIDTEEGGIAERPALGDARGR